MTKCQREINREQYEIIMKESNGKGYVPSYLESAFFPPSILDGYGLYGTSVAVEDGRYILHYTIGDSCD